MDNELYKGYLKEGFISLAVKYFIFDDIKASTNPAILRMIYAYNWTQIPGRLLLKKIEYHPDLTKTDKITCNEIKHMNIIENLIFIGFYGLFFNNRLRYLKAPPASLSSLSKNAKNKLFKLALWTSCTSISFALTNQTLIKWLVKNDIQKHNLSKYLVMNYDIETIKKDLKKYGVQIQENA